MTLIIIHITLHSSAPDGAPENIDVTMITSTSISLQWSPPIEMLWNGIIREYLINITEYNTGTSLVYYSMMTSLTVSSLHPYYTYLGQVSAFTVGYGPFDVFQVTTLQDGKYKVQIIVIGAYLIIILMKLQVVFLKIYLCLI